MVYDTEHASLNYVKYKLAAIQRLHRNNAGIQGLLVLMTTFKLA